MTRAPGDQGEDAGQRPATKILSLNGKDYAVDEENCLKDPNDWDEGFAAGMAPEAGIVGGLTEKHWKVIRFIRQFWKDRSSCPTVYQTCRMFGLHVARFRVLFPTGFQRGACKLAGISYKVGFPKGFYQLTSPEEKSYRIDIWGFLLDPDEWDDRFALLRAHEMKVPGGLTSDHWRVLRFMRQEYYRTRKTPALSETCDALGIGLEEFEALFPDGFYRGAAKIAGLRARSVE
ncbi:MAG: TusE/DsrC/DsvC family sulfur relay protein [Gemmatimonadota bacterium]